MTEVVKGERGKKGGGVWGPFLVNGKQDPSAD